MQNRDVMGQTEMQAGMNRKQFEYLVAKVWLEQTKFKGKIHPKMNILTFTHSHVVPNLYDSARGILNNVGTHYFFYLITLQ